MDEKRLAALETENARLRTICGNLYKVARLYADQRVGQRESNAPSIVNECARELTAMGVPLQRASGEQ